MSNLKERLADMSALSQSRTPADALKYIMKLESENKRLKALAADVIYSTGDDPEIMAASRAEWAARALAAEAKLAKEIEISNQRGNHIEFVLLPQMSDLQFQLKDVKSRIEELGPKLHKYDVLVKELFRLLDITEQTDEGRVFRPNKISSSRAMDAEKLEQVLKELKSVLEDFG